MNKFSLYFALFLFIFAVSCTLIAYLNKDADAVYLEVTRVVYVTNEITVIVPVTLPQDYGTMPAITTFPYETKLIEYTTNRELSVTAISVTVATDFTQKPEPQGKININTATADELTQLPGIGPALAERIIRYRTEYGNFSAVSDLLEVNGIGEKILDKIKGYIKI